MISCNEVSDLERSVNFELSFQVSTPLLKVTFSLMKLKVFSVFSLCLFIAIIGNRLFAQKSINGTDTTKMTELEIPEIFICSFKENTEISKLPSTVSLVNASQIERDEMESVVSLTAQVANVFMPDYGSKLTSPIYIRGIGSRINSPSVGLYVDGVSFFEKASFNFDFFDIDRIEVLKGPQGTLYGRNTMAGIINVLTKNPLSYQGTSIAISGGNYGYYKAKLAHYHQFSKKLGIMVGAQLNKNDGYFTNQFNQEKVDELDSYSARFKLFYKLAYNWEANFTSNYEWSNQGGYPYAILDLESGTADSINYNHYSSYQRQIWSNGLNIKFENDKFRFNSVTSHQYYDGKQDIDQDFTAKDLYGILQSEKQNMFSEELILRSNSKHNYQLLLGAYGFVQLFDKDLLVSFGDDFATTMDSYTKLYDNQILGAAIFHQSSYQISERLKIIGGLRLDTEKDIQDYRYDLLTKSGAEVNQADTLYPALSYSTLLSNIAINYNLNEHFSIYATLAQGYKAGGYNTTVTKPEELTFEPEKSINYEFGAKTFFFDGQVNANLSLFYIDIKNQQIYQTVSTGRGSYLENVGKSNSKGFELEIRAMPIKNLSTNFNYGYTKALIKDYYVDDSNNLAGNYIPYVPKHTIFIGVSYRQNVYVICDAISYSLNYKGVGKHYWNEENLAAQNYYSLLNGKVAFQEQNFIIEFWGKNLLNTNYHAFYFEALGNSYVQLGRPVTMGVNLKYKF